MRTTRIYQGSWPSLGLLLAALLLVGEVSGQGVTDRVTTRSGRHLEGTIIAYRPYDSLTLRLADGTIERFADVALLRIDYTEPQPSPRNRDERPSIPYAFRERGWQLSGSLGYLLGRETTIKRVFNCGFRNCSTVEEAEQRTFLGYSLQLAAGYRFHRWLELSGGLSWDRYNPERGEGVLTPELHYRGFLLARPLTPYLSLSGGYGLALAAPDAGIATASGGPMWHPAVGLRLGGRATTNLTVDVGYRFQSATYRGAPDDPDFRQRNVDYRRVVIRLGIIL